MWVGICLRSDPCRRTYAFVFVKGESVEGKGKFWCPFDVQLDGLTRGMTAGVGGELGPTLRGRGAEESVVFDVFGDVTEQVHWS